MQNPYLFSHPIMLNLYKHRAKRQIKGRIPLDNTWLKAVKDIPEAAIFLKRRAIFQLDDPAHAAYRNNDTKAQEHHGVPDHLNDHTKSARNDEHRRSDAARRIMSPKQ